MDFNHSDLNWVAVDICIQVKERFIHRTFKAIGNYVNQNVNVYPGIYMYTDENDLDFVI